LFANTAIINHPNGCRARASAVAPVPAFHLKVVNTKKQSTNISELDRVLGGGLIPGQVILFAGEPGIGKSTLLTQLATGSTSKNKVAYLCGEESPHQVVLRIKRIARGTGHQINLIPNTDVDEILAWLEEESPALVIVDSIQTLTTQDLAGVAGSIGQVRECASRLLTWAKRKQIPLLIVGHVTKQGAVAGPKVLEHAVDTVIYFEGERSYDLRLLRTVKNRFGPTDEIGVFTMTQSGLKQVTEEQLSRRVNREAKIGSALSVVAEGNRMIVVEIQALVAQSFTPIAKRVITGLPKNRTEMIIAIVQKHLRLPLFKYDVFINVAGGIKITEPAADLAVCAAILSSFRNRPLPARSCFIGEVSLLGEISPVSRLDQRIKQAKGLGATKVFSSRNTPVLAKLRALMGK